MHGYQHDNTLMGSITIMSWQLHKRSKDWPQDI